MSDDKRNPEPAERDLKDYEVRDWAKSLGVTEKELREAVQAAGTSPQKVLQYLRTH